MLNLSRDVWTQQNDSYHTWPSVEDGVQQQTAAWRMREAASRLAGALANERSTQQDIRQTDMERASLEGLKALRDTHPSVTLAASIDTYLRLNVWVAVLGSNVWNNGYFSIRW